MRDVIRIQVDKVVQVPQLTVESNRFGLSFERRFKIPQT